MELVELPKVVLGRINFYTNVWYTRQKLPSILPTRNIMERQRGSLNLDTITIHSITGQWVSG